MLGLEVDGRDRLGRDRALLSGHQVVDLPHQTRLEALAARREDRGRVRQLQHGEVVVALTDAQRNGLSRVPLLLISALVGLLLPFGRRQQSCDLAIEIDAGLAAEAERGELRVDQVDPHLVGQGVVVDVARFDDRAAHVHDPAALVLGAAVAVAAKYEEARVVDQRAGCSLVRMECGHRHERLEGRPRRVGAAQRTVQQGLVERLVEIAPGLDIDAVDEQVRVEGRLADEGEHLAVARIDGHQRAAPVAEQRFDERLQPDVDRQHDGVAGRRRVAVEPPHRAARGAGLDLFEAGRAVQVVLVALLDAELADVLGAAVVGRVITVVDGFLLGLVDAADVAEQVAADLAERIVAKQPRLHVDARKAEALCGEAGNLLVGQLGADRQRLEVLALVHQPLEALAVARLDVDDVTQALDGGLQVVDLRRADLEGVCRVVVCQHHTVAVDDQPAVGNDRHHRDAVVLGANTQFVVLVDLQVHQPHAEQAEAHQHEHCSGNQPQAKAPDLLFDVAQFGHMASRLTAAYSGRGRAGGVAEPAATMSPAARASPRTAARAAPASLAACRRRSCARRTTPDVPR